MRRIGLSANQNGFSLFILIGVAIMIWGIWSMFMAIIPDEQQDEISNSNSESSETIVEPNPLQQLSLKPKNGLSGSGTATREYTSFDGFKLKISAALPSLPEEVHYEGYYIGDKGTISLGELKKEASTYKAQYLSHLDQRDGYNTIRIRVEGAEGTVEGNSVPFTAMEGAFTEVR